MTETLVVNLFGGPGTGKSTMAAHIFAHLKEMGYSCELVREYAKDKVWEGSINVLDDQIHVFGEQYHRLHILKNKVDIILTDSPIILSVVYSNKFDRVSPSFNNFVFDVFNEMKNLNIFLNRVKEYKSSGRLQTENEAKQIDHYISDILEYNQIPYTKYDGNTESVDEIINLILSNHV